DGDPEEDAYDEQVLATREADLRLTFGELEDHRNNPLWHIVGLDLAGYVREYAPADERADARHRHLAQWPDAIDAAVEALDRVRAPVARGLLDAARGLAAEVDGSDPVGEAGLRAHARFIAHLEVAAATGDPSPAIGGDALARMMGVPEAMDVDLSELARAADAERDRLGLLLREACEQLRPGSSAAQRELIAELLADHPDPEGIYAEARALSDEATRFTIERDLIGDPGGVCLVGPAPPSMSWAMAMMMWSAPFEPDAPSWYWVTPPDPSWPPEQQEEWLTSFSRTTLPAITVHEVTPGHFAHGRSLRRLTSDVRRAVQSISFAEGWAHYAEELFVEEGFRADDPRFAIGVYVEALVRVTRLATAIGLHTGAMSLDDGIQRFEQDAFLAHATAKSETMRATFNPTYGYYTWGKLEILRARERARSAWGAAYTHRRFHESLLALGSPPLGLLDHALVTP
ncbi:MAG: hypothetical protein QOG30_3336, partial [Acidimicrobiaceae bacterium]